MASTTFYDNDANTPVLASWLNDVNQSIYNGQFQPGALTVLDQRYQSNPMTTLGDMLVAGTGGGALRLPAGAEGSRLEIVSGVPAWSTVTALAANTIIARNGAVTYTGNTSLPSADSGKVITYSNPTTDGAFILPLSNSAPAGELVYTIYCAPGPASVFIVGGGSDTGPYGGFTLTSDNILSFVNDGVSGWNVLANTGGTASLSFLVNTAVVASHAVPLWQADGRYAALAGSSSQVFAVADSTAATQQAVPRAQADTLYAAAGSTGFTNPMTAVGDLIIGGTAGAATALPVSTDGYVLTLAAGVPAWAAATGGGGTLFATQTDVTASRSAGTSYTNSSTGPLELLIWPTTSSVGASNYVQVSVVSGAVTKSYRAYPPFPSTLGGNTFSCIVPAGGSYSYSMGGTGTGVYRIWESQ